MTEESPAEQLTVGLIHELRHPLMGIKLGLQLIQRALGEEVARQAEWPMVLAQVVRLEELLRSYHEFLSPQLAGPTVFELGPALQRAVALCEIRLKPLGGRFEYRPPPATVKARGSPAALTHALTNVIFNALDAVEEQGANGRISIGVLPSPGNDGRLEVRVSDEGPGISPESASRIFEPRFTTKARDKGSGLGLSIARRMLRAADGEITLVDQADLFRQPWATTEFRISVWAHAQAATEQPAAAAPAPEAGPSRDSRKVLLVDDDKVVRTMLKRGLELSGFEVTATGTAEEAIWLLGSHPYDAVVTDKNLPEQSGEDVARAVRARSQVVALVLMTGFATHQSAREMRRLSADAYLAKPFELSDLARLLEQVIARRQGQAKLAADRSANPSPAPIHRIAVIEPDPGDRARLEKLLREQALDPLVREDVAAALSELPPPDAMVINSACLDEALQQQLIRFEVARPEFRVVLISSADSMLESITAILLNARSQLIQPWTEGHARGELRRALLEPIAAAP